MDAPEHDPGATVEAAAVDPGYALAERVRGASFKVARRGYDRGEVDTFLAWLADELRGAELAPVDPAADPDAVRRELERVGESTAEILRAAEQTARELRGSAQRDADSVASGARVEADRMRAEAEEFAATARAGAEEETRKLTLEADRRAQEVVREAEGRAESIVEDALQRRRLLAARVEHLAERRGAILAEVGRLAEELRALRESAAAIEVNVDEDEAEGTPLAAPADLEPVEEALPDELDESLDAEDEVEFDELDSEPLPGDATEVLDTYEDVEDAEGPAEEPR
jgi:DivIVA domain-containing protein